MSIRLAWGISQLPQGGGIRLGLAVLVMQPDGNLVHV